MAKKNKKKIFRPTIFRGNESERQALTGPQTQKAYTKHTSIKHNNLKQNGTKYTIILILNNLNENLPMIY